MKSPIDFTLLYDKTEGYAVHCSNPADAELFVYWASSLFPKLCSQWAPGETNYQRNGSDTIYTFDASRGDSFIKFKLMYGDVDSAIYMGYKVIEFSEIYQEEDIDESEASLDVLFG